MPTIHTDICMSIYYFFSFFVAPYAIQLGPIRHFIIQNEENELDIKLQIKENLHHDPHTPYNRYIRYV